MKKKRYILSILIISCLFIFVGCDNNRSVRDTEVEEFTDSIMESNNKIKELDFYFRRPSLRGELVYDGDLSEDELQELTNEFKTLIDVEFMEKIGDKYWKGSKPSSFYLKVYVDEKREEDFDYEISSDYNKTYVSDEEPDNIDGYETWFIYDKKKEELLNKVENINEFTEKEIAEAIKVVTEKFDFPAATLTKVWYDEEKSDKFAIQYLEGGKGSVNDAEFENVIVILSNFDVDDSGDNPVLNPGSTYENYMWILIRDDETSPWEIDDFGY